MGYKPKPAQLMTTRAFTGAVIMYYYFNDKGKVMRGMLAVGLRFSEMLTSHKFPSPKFGLRYFPGVPNSIRPA